MHQCRALRHLRFPVLAWILMSCVGCGGGGGSSGGSSAAAPVAPPDPPNTALVNAVVPYNFYVNTDGTFPVIGPVGNFGGTAGNPSDCWSVSLSALGQVQIQGNPNTTPYPTQTGFGPMTYSTFINDMGAVAGLGSITSGPTLTPTLVNQAMPLTVGHGYTFNGAFGYRYAMYVQSDLASVATGLIDGAQLKIAPLSGNPVIASMTPTSGATSASVTIIGTDLGLPTSAAYPVISNAYQPPILKAVGNTYAQSSSNTITFNGALATVTNISNNGLTVTITVQVPATATTGPVMVTTPYGSANAGTFTLPHVITSGLKTNG